MEKEAEITGNEEQEGAQMSNKDALLTIHSLFSHLVPSRADINQNRFY